MFRVQTYVVLLLLILSCFAEAKEEKSDPKKVLCDPLSYVFLEPPEKFSQQVEVAGCFCEFQGRILLLLRNPEKPQGNTWCIPGGKLNSGETPLQAIVREVEEETGLHLPDESLTYCRTVYIRFPNSDIVLHLFRIQLLDVPRGLCVSACEHSAYCWATLEEALEMPLIPGGGDCMRIALR
jgi:mutator protein MutT